MLQVLDKNQRSGFISMARNSAAMKSTDLLQLLSDCASASVNEAIIHNQPRLIKRLSRNVPPQRIGWLSAVGTDRNRAVLLSVINFIFISLHFSSFFFCFVMLSVQISISPLEGFTPWTLEKLKASDSLWFSPLNSTKGNTGSVYRRSVIICGWRQRSGRKWGIRELRLKSVGL